MADPSQPTTSPASSDAGPGAHVPGSGDRVPAPAIRLRAVWLTVFLIAACGLGYELVAGTLGSYVLGDAVTQFSTTIGLYLFALGIGAWLSKFVQTRLVERFVEVEASVALLGGTMAATLYLLFASGTWFRPLFYVEIVAAGTLVGLEIPLLLRILKDDVEFKDLVSSVLAFDYVGSLVLSLVFATLLIPRLGLVRSGLVLGLLNAFVGLWSTYLFEARIERPRPLRAKCAVAIVVLTAGMAWSDAVTDHVEATMFGEETIYARTSAYQRIVVTGQAGPSPSFSLWLNGALQFHSGDEYRYHEALVHPAMGVVEEPRRVLVLGGGDGLAVREILRHEGVERVTLVDIDPEMTRMATTLAPLVALNEKSLSDPRVTVVNADAMQWLSEKHGIFDVAVVDFPDPASFSVGKLYTVRFYERLLESLAPDGALVVQATSPFHARRSFWCIAKTLEAAGLVVRPYRQIVPSFRGDWGFLVAARRQFEIPSRLPRGLRSLDAASLRALFVLPPDVGPVDVEVNRLDNQVLVRYYDEEWRTSGS